MLDIIKRNKYVVIALAAVLALGWGGYKYYQSTKTPTATVKTGTVSQGKLTESISATGSLSAVDNVDISSKITGRIVEVPVVENQHVNAGDVLVKLDDTALRATMNQAKARLDYAEANYNRYVELLNRGAISQQNFDSILQDYRVARNTYEKAVSDVNDTIIKTPIEGYIIGKPKNVGTTISSGISEPQVIMSVATLDKMQIQVLVDESDIGQVKVGQKVRFTVDSFSDDNFTGVVRLVSRKATTSNNVVYYTVYVDVDDSKGKLLPTMTARTEIIVAESEEGMIVPLNCIYRMKGRTFVKVYNEQTKESRDVDVKLGLSNDDSVMVTADLKKGEKLLVKKAVAKQSGTNNRIRPHL